jgi:hypothetical protein
MIAKPNVNLAWVLLWVVLGTNYFRPSRPQIFTAISKNWSQCGIAFVGDNRPWIEFFAWILRLKVQAEFTGDLIQLL